MTSNAIYNIPKIQLWVISNELLFIRKRWIVYALLLTNTALSLILLAKYKIEAEDDQHEVYLKTCI